MKICPKCKCEYYTPSSLSRVDSKTEICESCGNIEGIAKMVNPRIKMKTNSLTGIEKKLRYEILKDIFEEIEKSSRKVAENGQNIRN